MSQYIPITLVSNDPNCYTFGVGQKEYGFVTTLASPIVFDQSDLLNWQVVLVGASFYHPGPAGPLFFYSNICQPQTVGSGSDPLLAIVPAASVEGPYSFVATSNPPAFSPITAVTSTISIYIRDQYGNPAYDPTNQTPTVSLMLVRCPSP